MKSVKIDYIPRYTYSDYSNWEGRWELIGGVAYAMTPLPVIEHQEVSKRIIIQFSELLKECGKCKVLLPVDWKIDEDTVLQPDVSVVCNKAEGKYLTEPPVIIFEILSPSTVFKDRNIKYKIYESQRVRYYVLVDIEAKVAEVFYLKDETYVKLKDAQADVVTFDLMECKLNFDFGEIWP